MKKLNPVNPVTPVEPVAPIPSPVPNQGFYFRGIEDHCFGCPSFEPIDYPQRLGSGAVMHYVECKNAGRCRAIKSHLEKQISLPSK